MGRQPPELPSDAVSDEASSACSDDPWDRWRALTIEAYGRFHARLGANRDAFPGLTAYDPVERIDNAQGTFAWWWGAAGEARETINSINGWGVRLHEWGAWNLVVDSYENDEDKWDVLNHFAEPVAYFCMLQPSSFVDRLTVTTETLLHQANQRVFNGEPDRLDQDRLKPGTLFRRSDRRRQLDRLGRRWSQFAAFRHALHALDNPGYRTMTRNFRDLSAHSFAPRLMHGHVARAIRSIAPKSELVPQPDGSYLRGEHPTKKGVQYAMSEMAPLPLEAARTANLGEYQKALQAMVCFADLIDELCERIASAPMTATKHP